MKPSNGQNIIITGVSSGIGQETSRCLAKHGYRVFGSVRKIADAEALQRELADRFHPMVFDVCDGDNIKDCLLYTSPSPRDATLSRMPSSA